MPEFQRFSYDVLVIGAGGAGLRAAIEAAANGARVGVVCKSLLGKAHTVMAEGGIAAALANVDDRDNWRVHFADTMSGGQYLNNWKPGARFLTAPRMGGFCSATSVGTNIRAWRTSAIAPGWR
jgi:succinate dehydrogenase/fumarate reductase flavoprotein subunit